MQGDLYRLLVEREVVLELPAIPAWPRAPKGGVVQSNLVTVGHAAGKLRVGGMRWVLTQVAMA